MIFKTETKTFYRKVEKEVVTVNETPTIEDFGKFWIQIWIEAKRFNEESE